MMRKTMRFCLCALLALPVFAGFQAAPSVEISVEDGAESCRVLLEFNQNLSTDVEKVGADLLVRIRSERPLRMRRRSFQSRFVESLGWSQSGEVYSLNIKIQLENFSYLASNLQDSPGLVIDVLPRGPGAGQPASGAGGTDREEARADSPGTEGAAASGGASQLESGIKTVVIDPGHGGLEIGAKGPNGTLEKDVTLKLGLKLKALIERNLAFRVVMTRDKDIDVPLDNRAAIANNNRAFVFISIHANGYYHTRARGSETYFLNLNATDEEARRLAYMENNSSELERIEGENEDDIRLILWDLAQSAYLKQSSQLAELIQNELNTLLSTLNRGVKQAPFKVLTGVACPAVLVEVAFISNPTEEKNLIREDYQDRIVEAIYNGLYKYLRVQERGRP
jgi:N-acetylmuramoyl-L-alanine amidase